MDLGSITIYYNGGNKTLKDALSKLQASGINFVDAPGKKIQPGTITKTVLSLNEQIKQATQETIDVRSRRSMMKYCSAYYKGLYVILTYIIHQ